MTALSNYRIRSSNGSENVSASIFSGFAPVDVFALVGSGLSEDDMELVSYLSLCCSTSVLSVPPSSLPVMPMIPPPL